MVSHHEGETIYNGCQEVSSSVGVAKNSKNLTHASAHVADCGAVQHTQIREHTRTHILMVGQNRTYISRIQCIYGLLSWKFYHA